MQISNNIQYAGFAKRLKAIAYDYLLILTYIIILAVFAVIWWTHYWNLLGFRM